MVLVVACFGLIIGSFVNAAVWRIHKQGKEQIANSKELSLWGGRSMCPNCKHQLAAKDLVPILSWVSLGGECRYCHKPISGYYPAVEFVTAALFTISYMQLRPDDFVGYLNFGIWLYFLTALIILAVYDLRWYILPDKVLLPAIVIAGAWLLARWGLEGSVSVILSPLAAALAAGGIFYAIAAVSDGKWMGGGDIKLAFLMGLLLGGTKTVVAMALAFNVAAIVGIALIALKLKKRSEQIPFGPFLAGGTVLAYLYGQYLVEWYLQIGIAI